MPVRISKAEEQRLQLCSTSSMSASYLKSPERIFDNHALTIDKLRIDIYGSLSKLPSVSNSRMVRVDSRGVQKMVSGKADSFQVINSLKKLRPMSVKSPESQRHIEALTRLWENTTGKTQLNFGDSKHRRVFVLGLLSDACSRMDAHNIDKFICDWLQEVGVINNDRNANCFCLHKQNCTLPLDKTCSTVVACVLRGETERQLETLINTVIGNAT